MNMTIERSASPLYDAIREVMAGTWPEDEYDVAESPLSYVDYKSQVPLEAGAGGVVPVRASVVSSEGEYESVTCEAPVRVSALTAAYESAGSSRRSSDSGFGEEGDETMATEAGPEAEGKPEESGGEAERQAEETNPLRAEPPELHTAPDTPPPHRPAAATPDSVREQITDIFRADFPVAPPIEISIPAPAAAEPTHPGAATPPATATTPDPTLLLLLLRTPPIPSRSPSRPGTSSRANLTTPPPDTLSSPPDRFSPQQRCDSTLSLPPLKHTVSSMSSPRSSRFFEDLGDTTATSTAVSEKTPVEPLNQAVVVAAPQGKKEKARGARRRWVWRSCGLEALFRKLRLGGGSGSRGKGHHRASGFGAVLKKW